MSQPDLFRVSSEADKQALVHNQGSQFFTPAHFAGQPSMRLRASRIGEIPLWIWRIRSSLRSCYGYQRVAQATNISGHEDAERVPCQVSKHVQGLVGIVAPIEQDHRTQDHSALPLPLKLGAVPSSEI